MSGPNRGPQGKDLESFNDTAMPEPQERYEAYGEHVDYKGGEPTQDPFTLKAHEEDHTPNHTRAPKGEKTGWNFQHGRGNGGVGI